MMNLSIQMCLQREFLLMAKIQFSSGQTSNLAQTQKKFLTSMQITHADSSLLQLIELSILKEKQHQSPTYTMLFQPILDV